MKKKPLLWARKIRKNILDFFALLIFLTATGVVYYAWGSSELKQLNDRVNNYHLASNNHFLLANKNIRDIALALINFSHLPVKSRSYSELKHDTDIHFYINQREIEKALAIQDIYQDEDFKLLLNRISASLNHFNAQYLSLWQDDTSIPKIINTAEELLDDFEIIILLHRIEYESLSSTLKDQTYYHFIFNCILIIALTLLALIMARQGLKAINEAISQQLKDKARIQHQAHYDYLTQLPNRFLAQDRLSQSIALSKRQKCITSVLFLDLDDFKKVNDTLGHGIGDLLLIEASKRLLDVVRDVDTVGRLGGDEFIIILGEIHKVEYAHRVADKIIQQFRDPFLIENREVILTISVGISIYPGDGENSTEMIRSADSAMYYSKEHGRNMYSFFTQSMNNVVSRRLAIEEQMYNALERKELQVHYQPKIELKTGRLMGAEALIRWKNPILGQVPPDEFIHIAEQTGAIVKLGEFVITQALDTCRHWKNNFNQSITMAVNVSPRQFRQDNFVHFIQAALQSHHLSGEDLELEITEGLFLGGEDYIQDTLSQLGELGIQLAMDDFGTGYSSLSYLRSFPFSVLKIDRCFISSLIENNADQKLVNAAISLAHSLKIKVVAEGVETSAQHDYLEHQGCDYVQGYFYGKPMSEAEFEVFLKKDINFLKPSKQAQS